MLFKLPPRGFSHPASSWSLSPQKDLLVDAPPPELRSPASKRPSRQCIIRFEEEVRNETASIEANECALRTLNRNVIVYIDLLGEQALKRFAP